MQGKQPQDLSNRDRDRTRGDVGKAVSRFLRVGRLHPDHEGDRRQDTEGQGDHQRSRRCREVGVREGVTAPVDTQGADVQDVRALHHHAAVGSPKINGVDDQEHIRGSAHQLLHQVDPADANLQDPHPFGEPLHRKCLRHRGSDPVIGPEHVAETGHHGVHGPRVGESVLPEQEALIQRLALHPVDRYPVQHATTQFHLGTSLLQGGAADSAAQALQVSQAVFAEAGMRLEQAKAGVMLGVALRASGRLDEAGAVFADAGTVLAALDQPAEQAAASYNLGLVLQDSGQDGAARRAWAVARELFLTAGHPTQAAAAARDHGASLLAAGEVAEALPLLRQATQLALAAGDDPGTGMAANVLGLAHLADGDPAAASEALRRSLSCFPRHVRPADHAMVKANLALVHEQAGAFPRARLAAGQALAVPNAAPPVRQQAAAVLDRLGVGDGLDLLSVLDEEEPGQWVPVLREELLRLLELSSQQRWGVMDGFLGGLLTRPGASYGLAESLLHVVLELPPRPYDVVVTTMVDVCGQRTEDDADRLRSILGSAMARFAMPQWQRLAASLNAAAQRAGHPAVWT